VVPVRVENVGQRWFQRALKVYLEAEVGWVADGF
jgi:hypothetical protein